MGAPVQGPIGAPVVREEGFWGVCSNPGRLPVEGIPLQASSRATNAGGSIFNISGTFLGSWRWWCGLLAAGHRRFSFSTMFLPGGEGRPSLRLGRVSWRGGFKLRFWHLLPAFGLVHRRSHPSCNPGTIVRAFL